MKPNIKYHMSYIQKKLRWYPQQLQCNFYIFFLPPSPEHSLHSSPKPSPEPGELDLALHQFPKPFPDLFCNLLQNPLTLSSGTLLNLAWLYTIISQTFSGTLLNLTWLCTKASQTFSGSFSGTFSRSLLNLTWLCTQSPNLRNLLGKFFEPDPAPAPVHTGAILGWRPH